jgi:hypothetical protein
MNRKEAKEQKRKQKKKEIKRKEQKSKEEFLKNFLKIRNDTTANSKCLLCDKEATITVNVFLSKNVVDNASEEDPLNDFLKNGIPYRLCQEHFNHKDDNMDKIRSILIPQ